MHIFVYIVVISNLFLTMNGFIPGMECLQFKWDIAVWNNFHIISDWFTSIIFNETNFETLVHLIWNSFI